MKVSCIPICYFQDILDTRTMSVEDWVKIASDIGLDGTEICRPFLEGRGPGTINQLVTSIKKGGLQVSMFNSTTHFAVAGSAELELQIKRAHQDIDYASFFGTRILCFSCGDLIENISQGDIFSSISKGLTESLDYAQRRGITVVLENCCEITPKIDDFMHILDLVNDNRLKVNFNTSNFTDPAESVLKFLELMADRIAYVHANDRNENLKYTMIGEGLVDFSEVFKVLKGCGYDGWISIECVGKGKKGSIKKGMEFIRNAWNDIK